MSDALIITITFLIAGGVKGVLGLGLPTVSLGLLAIAVDLTTAMALMLIPSFVTNVWQSLVGGNVRILVQRIWPFLLFATLSIWIGTIILVRVELYYLTSLLGILLLIYGGLNLAGFRIRIALQQERWLGPLAGTANGVLTGMTGSFVFPGVLYLQAIGLPRDMLIQAMGMLFTLSTIGLAFALQRNQMLPADLVVTSTISVLPAVIGMIIGQRIRQTLSEQLFRNVFFVAIGLLGMLIVIKSLI